MFKLKLEKFFKEDLWQYAIVLSFGFIFAYIFNKYIETIFFIIAYTVIRTFYDGQRHYGIVVKCLQVSVVVLFIGVYCTLPLCVSIISSIPVALIISEIGKIAQDRIDTRQILKKLSSKTVYEMDENELADYCFAKGIRGDMLEFVIMVLIYNMKYEDIGKKLGYAVDTLKDWSPKCKEKLGIKSWKN